MKDELLSALRDLGEAAVVAIRCLIGAAVISFVIFTIVRIVRLAWAGF